MKLANLGANSVICKGSFNLAGYVAIHITEPVTQQNEQNERHDSDRGGDSGNHQIATIQETATATLRCLRSRALRIDIGEAFSFRRQRLIGLRLQGLTDLLLF